jgi:hypothetical protein
MLNLGMGQDIPQQVKKDTTTLQKHTISDTELATFWEDPQFNYEVEKSEAPGWWTAFKNWLGNLLMQFFEWLFGIEKAAGAFQSFLQVLPYLLLVLLIFILIKFFLNVNASAMANRAKEMGGVHLSDEEKILKHEDIKGFLQQALDYKDYRLAVRYYYLFILQQMSQKELISWAVQKTNVDYLNEIEKKELQASFGQITRWYNYIWYGDFPIDAKGYDKIQASFIELEQQLTHA